MNSVRLEADYLNHPRMVWNCLLISGFRCIFLAILIFSLNKFVGLGTAPFWVSISSWIGVGVGTWLAFSALNNLGLLFLIFSMVLAQKLIFYLLGILPLPLNDNLSFVIFTIHQHSELLLGAACLGMASAWLFWRFKNFLTIEILALVAGVIALLAGHRNYHFDTPAHVTGFAWRLQVDQLAGFILLASLAGLSILTYTLSSSLPGRQSAHSKAAPVKNYRSKFNVLLLALFAMILGGIFWFVSSRTYHHFQREADSRVANGVGQASQEGLSPLGFHSALGSTNEPAALVRLEGDYGENPFTPMLYLREGALSQFNGHELVIASRKFDLDTTGTTPFESFVGEEDIDLTSRVPIIQSVYLLTDHKLAFAIDYPVSITALKNPNPQRFKAAYRAYSAAPGFSIADISNMSVGDPRWPEYVRRHYLEPHSDVRYQETALAITSGVNDPVAKALAITNYLNKRAIYTLSPHHELNAGDDPVAPFLFGDMRGYCVHFAHATVYMLRALGLPARIGTGYLTDMSQAKDGHILLRMSDRHAWAEVYVTGRGWIPFDTQPEQVESHADTAVDMKVLEELMNLLEPGEEILPPNIAKEEPGLSDDPGEFFPSGTFWLRLTIGLFIFIALIKLYLRFSYLIPGRTDIRLKRYYVAIASWLLDLGLERSQGETRMEFAKRVGPIVGPGLNQLTEQLLITTYAAPDNQKLVVLPAKISVPAQTPLRRVRAIFNPASVFSLIGGSRW